MATDPKQISRRVIEEVWNKKNLNAADELIATNFVSHDAQSPMPVRGVEGYKQLVKHYLEAFPDCHFTIEDQIAEGQMEMTRWSVTSTHKGNLGNIPATGRQMTITGITFSRMENGKLAEMWTNWDTLGMLQQLGVLAAPAQRAA